jgi:hypothetical protein
MRGERSASHTMSLAIAIVHTPQTVQAAAHRAETLSEAYAQAGEFGRRGQSEPGAAAELLTRTLENLGRFIDTRA